MAAEDLAKTILQKCDIYYGDSLISREAIIERYVQFFISNLHEKKRSVSFALHTGSSCFDFASIAAVALSCISDNISTNDDIIANIQTGDMVMFRNQRYRWRGIVPKYDGQYMALEQDGKGRNGKSTFYVPFEKNKHLIKPYNGSSSITDGRGVRKAKANREDFLSYLYGIQIENIPSVLDISIVIIANRMDFYDIGKNLHFVYGNGKQIGLLDLVPASYYTSGGEEYQYGVNQTKAEAVLKVTGKIETARNLVLDKHINKVVGLLVTNIDSLTENSSELADLIRRKSLKFVHIVTSSKTAIGERIIEMYEDAEVFACTKNYLKRTAKKIAVANPLTIELEQQISNIVNKTITPLNVEGGWCWEEYKKIRNGLSVLRRSNWMDDKRDDFIISAHGLLNLLTTAVFSMNEMEAAIADGMINPTVISPAKRIEGLWNIAYDAGMMQDLCAEIACSIEEKYREFADYSPKENVLYQYLQGHSNLKIAIIVPKAYYSDLLALNPMFDEYSENVVCVTANRFDLNQYYDSILVVGDFTGKRFDALQCQSSEDVEELLYDYEGKLFKSRKKKQQKYERVLEARASGSSSEELSSQELSDDSSDEDDVVEETMVQEFDDFNQYIESLNVFDIRKYASNGESSPENAPIAEVCYIGTFVTGEQIFFTRYYSPVVFHRETATVVETSVEKLLPGDLMVFAKRDDFTKNIVDLIYEKLLQANMLSAAVVEATEKAAYWKEALREFKERENCTYRDIARKLRQAGCSLQEVTVRQWLIEDSHIVGPRNVKTMECIAFITQDPYLLDDIDGTFEACRLVRHERRAILKLIAEAINGKLSGRVPPEGDIFEIVYDNVDNLSELLELEYISALDKSINVSVNLVNRPITESEVSI